MWGGGADLQGLCDEHALHEGDHHGQEPAEGGGPPVVQAVEHGKEGCHTTGGCHQEPAHQDAPPGQATWGLAGPQGAAKGSGGTGQGTEESSNPSPPPA